MTTVITILGVVAVAVLLAVGVLYSRFKSTHNLIVALDQRCNTAFADIDVHMKHRHNLIPGLLGIVKGATGHERDIVLGIVDARSRALGALSNDVRLEAEGNLTAHVSTLLSTVDKYPELRALPEFGKLRDQVTACEERITASRRFYNLAIEEYNTSLRQFPGSMIAQKMRFSSRRPFDLGVERVLIDEPLAIAF